MIKKINVFLLSLIVAISPIIFMNRALANAYSDAGWDISNRMAQGASTIINGVKNVGGAVARGTAKITPAAADVSKVLVRGAGGYALTVAVEQLLGAVDWVLDPANNQITYIDPNAIQPPQNYQYYFEGSKRASSSVPFPIYYTLKQACGDQLKLYFPNEVDPLTNRYCGVPYPDGHIYFYYTGNSTPQDQIARRYANPAYDPQAQPERKKLPLDAVSDKIIANANAGDAAAQAVTGTAANDIANDDAKAPPIIAQLEATKTYDQAGTAAGTATKPNTADPTAPPEVTDLALEFPAFCGWAPIVCEAAQKVISFPNTLTSWWDYAKGKSEEWVTSISTAWAEAKDWAKGEPELADTPLEVEEQQILSYQYEQHLSFGASCPFTPQTTVIDFGISSFSMQHDFSIVCDVALEVRPYVISLSHLGALLYLIYAIRNGNG